MWYLIGVEQDHPSSVPAVEGRADATGSAHLRRAPAEVPGDPAGRTRTLRLRALWAALVVVGAGVLILSMLAGTGDLSDPRLRETFLELRAWRTAAAFLAGAGLAVGGVLVQGLFRNPLASPSIIGATAGANLGGMSVLLAFEFLLGGRAAGLLPAEMLLPAGCMVGALVSLALLLAIVRRSHSIVAVLLTGFILSALFASIGGLLTSLAQESWELGRAMVSFTLGGVDGKGARHVGLALPLVIGGSVAAWMWGRHLDVLLSGDDEARSLGVEVAQVRRWCIAWTATLTAAAVAIGGNVAFVGLVVPNALRSYAGVEHRRLIPAALVGGGVFLVACDVAVRLLPARGVVPLGVVTGLVGAPVFLWLMIKSQRELAG